MRAIALAIILAGWGIELAIRNKTTDDLTEGQSLAGGVLVICLGICIMAGF